MQQLHCYVSALSVMLQMKSLPVSKTLLSSLLKIIRENLIKFSLEKSDLKALLQKAIIDKLLLDVVSDTNPSECHNPSDSTSNVAQTIDVNVAESVPIERQQDHLSGLCLACIVSGQWWYLL